VSISVTKDRSIFKHFRQALQVVERRITGAKIVQNEPHTLGTQGGHRRNGVLHVAHEQTFGEFQFEPARADAGTIEHILDLLDKVGLVQLAVISIAQQV
jgi:hypothetical protein